MDISYLSLFFFTASQIGLLISGLLLWPKKNFKQNIFLSLAIFSLSVCSLYNFCYSAGLIDKAPAFFTIAKSASFLIAPCSFLYIRNILYPDNKRKKYNWIHFSVFFGTLIYFEIYRLTRTEEFVNMLNSAPNVWQFYNSVGVSFHYIAFIKVIAWFAYGLAQTWLIINYERKAAYTESVYNYKLVNWLKTYNLFIMILFSSLIVQRVADTDIAELDFLNEITMSLTLLAVGVWLIFQPHILYGTDIQPEEIYAKTEVTLPEDNSIPAELMHQEELSGVHAMFEDNKRDEYLGILKNMMKVSKPFLNKGYLIKDLAEETNIPVHHLSFLINTEYKLHFQDFINLQRIEYLKDRINDPDLQQLSLEGMAWEVGFKSRTTFFRAFIKFTGYSPSEYFSNFNKTPGDESAATA